MNVDELQGQNICDEMNKWKFLEIHSKFINVDNGNFAVIMINSTFTACSIFHSILLSQISWLRVASIEIIPGPTESNTI